MSLKKKKKIKPKILKDEKKYKNLNKLWGKKIRKKRGTNERKKQVKVLTAFVKIINDGSPKARRNGKINKIKR